MSDIQTIIVKEDGQEYQFYIESPETIEVPDEEPDYRDISLPAVDMRKIHSTIRGYARYAVGAFGNFGLAEADEMTLEFNLKIAGKAGLPVLAEASTEGVFKIQVKCKFPGEQHRV